MSLQAVGWLGSKLGLNITGRTEGGERAENPENPDGTSEQLHTRGGGGGQMMSDVGSGITQYWKQTSQAVSSLWRQDHQSTSPHSPGTSGGGIFSLGDDNTARENTDVDENGLPTSKSWYYFDKQLNRWCVTPEAPESIKQEHYQRLKDDEDERLGLKKVAPPPPPPPAAAMGGLPPPKMGGDNGGEGIQQGFFTSPNGQPRRGLGPQYAIPDYFGTPAVSSAAPPSVAAVAVSYPHQLPQYPPPPAGPYGQPTGSALAMPPPLSGFSSTAQLPPSGYGAATPHASPAYQPTATPYSAPHALPPPPLHQFQQPHPPSLPVQAYTGNTAAAKDTHPQLHSSSVLSSSGASGGAAGISSAVQQGGVLHSANPSAHPVWGGAPSSTGAPYVPTQGSNRPQMVPPPVPPYQLPATMATTTTTPSAGAPNGAMPPPLAFKPFNPIL